MITQSAATADLPHTLRSPWQRPNDQASAALRDCGGFSGIHHGQGIRERAIAFRLFGDLDPSEVKGALSHRGFAAELKKTACRKPLRACSPSRGPGANSKDS